MDEIASPSWQKSTHCTTGTCVEVARSADHCLIRDSKHPDQTPLSFSAAEWTAFIRAVAAGEFPRTH